MTATSAAPADARRLGIAEVEKRTGRQRTTIWRWCRDGRFPAPHYLGERRAWWLHEIEAWEREQMERPPESRRRDANLRTAEAKP
jgi:prophage regulatory protein